MAKAISKKKDMKLDSLLESNSAQKDVIEPIKQNEGPIYLYTKQQWDLLLSIWRDGWASETTFEKIDNYIELKRSDIFEGPRAEDFEGNSTDWYMAANLHDFNKDIIANRHKYNEDLRDMYLEWYRDGKNHFANLSLESLKSMLILTGAAIIYSFSILSGEVSNPNSDAVIVAKVTIVYSVISMIMTAFGHALNSWALNFSTSRIRGVLVGNVRHKRLYSLHRYMVRYYDPITKWANAMIYGAMAVFGLGFLLSTIILF